MSKKPTLTVDFVANRSEEYVDDYRCCHHKDYDHDSEESEPGLFSEMLKKTPGRVASTLKRFHKQRSPKRRYLASDIANVIPSCSVNSRMDTFLTSGLPIVLIEIASESSLYKRWGADADATHYAADILTGLALCVGYIQRLHLMPSSPLVGSMDIPCLMELSIASERLWTTLWNKRTVLFPFPEALDAMYPEPIVHPQDFSSDLVHMARFLNTVKANLAKNNTTSESFKSDSSPSYVTHVDHVMFYIWLSSPMGDGLNALDAMGPQLDEDTIDYDYDYDDLLLTELAEFHHVVKFVDSIDFLLKSGIDEDTRVIVLDMYHRAILCCEQVSKLENVRFQHGHITTVHRIAYSCQRMFCMPDHDDVIAEVVRGLQIIRDTVFHGEMSYEKVGPVFNELQYFEMIAKAYPVAVAKGWENQYEALTYACLLYQDVYHTILQEETQDLEAAAVMNRAVAHLWRPVLEELQSLRLHDENRDLVLHAKTTWVKLGSQFGLTPEKHDPKEDHAVSMHEARHIRHRRCQWRDCLCTTHRPEHSMRICKGCWKKRYCSKRCQKSDWREGGHREWCRT
ncbi:hypothetical protein QCA50_005725 [Cerrena zonata]|uniref:MYND-type domain-containing protein n=1 Tax=Cerrena zonata TaxID=2478898 RepID=A0AAW0GCH9_9APHY